MVIHLAFRAINDLRQILPKGFVFVLDSTDRSFIYKSKDYGKYEEFVLRFDQDQGIDLLSKSSDYFEVEQEETTLQVKTLTEHTYIGICVNKKDHTKDDLYRSKERLTSEASSVLQ